MRAHVVAGSKLPVRRDRSRPCNSGNQFGRLGEMKAPDPVNRDMMRFSPRRAWSTPSAFDPRGHSRSARPRARLPAAAAAAVSRAPNRRLVEDTMPVVLDALDRIPVHWIGCQQLGGFFVTRTRGILNSQAAWHGSSPILPKYRRTRGAPICAPSVRPQPVISNSHATEDCPSICSLSLSTPARNFLRNASRVAATGIGATNHRSRALRLGELRAAACTSLCACVPSLANRDLDYSRMICSTSGRIADFGW